MGPGGLPPQQGRRLEDPDEFDGAALGGLTRWFAPFLPHFIAETLRVGGEAWVLGDREDLRALLLLDPLGPVASVHARTTPDAEALTAGHPGPPVFSEEPLSGPSEPFTVHRWRPAPRASELRLRHPVRRATPTDDDAALALFRAGLGAVDRRWFDGLPRDREIGFVAEVGGEVVGASWLLLIGRHARLHSLAVAPRFRGLGIARDLVTARLDWARRHGAVDAIAEVAERTTASAAALAASGFLPEGRIYLGAPRGPDGTAQVLGAPHLGQTVAVESMSVPQ